MAKEMTKEEIERRAQELARRVMAKPYAKQEWPREPKKGRPKAKSRAATVPAS
jgi:hypothetical protein